MSVQHPTSSLPVRSAEKAANEVAQSTAFEVFSRAGFAARATIYAVIGILAIKLALGAGGKTTDQSGAMKTIAHQPLGHVLLILVAIGLAGYSVWRLAHAALGHGPERSDSALDRLSALGSGVSYAAMCALAVTILLGSGGGTSGHTSKATAGVLAWPGGTWLVGFAGALFVGVALYQGYRGLTRDFMKDAKTGEMSATTRNWYEAVAVFGHVARSVVFGLVGIFLIKAAIEYDPSKAVGLDGALAKLANQSYGSALLGLVAAGLIAFALYSLADVRYRRI
jgi:uncharacterized protein DUF1206